MKEIYKMRLKIINGVLYKVSLLVIIVYFLFIKEADFSWSFVFIFIGCALGLLIIITEILLRLKR
jgi:hypothetical protein